MKACKIRGLQKSFARNHVLRGIDLDLNAGEVLVLMGANGAGKSTLVKVLCGFHMPDAGSITLAGEDYQPQDAATAISRGVVTVHQSIDDGVIPDLEGLLVVCGLRYLLTQGMGPWKPVTTRGNTAPCVCDSGQYPHAHT